MKYWIVLLLSTFLYGQAVVQPLSILEPEYFTVTLYGTDAVDVYYIFPPTNRNSRTAIDSTLPTSAALQAINQRYVGSGALTIAAVTDTTVADTTEKRQDSDSLYMYIQSLIYDNTKATWYPSTNDTLFLDFDTPGTYTGTVLDYLDWTHGSCYTANLGGSVMPAAGYAITIGQVATDIANPRHTIYLSFWHQK